jgi:hypothetical protein
VAPTAKTQERSMKAVVMRNESLGALAQPEDEAKIMINFD